MPDRKRERGRRSNGWEWELTGEKKKMRSERRRREWESETKRDMKWEGGRERLKGEKEWKRDAGWLVMNNCWWEHSGSATLSLSCRCVAAGLGNINSSIKNSSDYLKTGPRKSVFTNNNTQHLFHPTWSSRRARRSILIQPGWKNFVGLSFHIWPRLTHPVTRGCGKMIHLSSLSQRQIAWLYAEDVPKLFSWKLSPSTFKASFILQILDHEPRFWIN